MSDIACQAEQWFIKNDHKIMGPFSIGVLTSMQGRGRVSPSTLVSPDRKVWYSISELGPPFAELTDATVTQPSPLIGGELMPAPSHAPVPLAPTQNFSAAGQCFYSVDGVVHGPIPAVRLQERIDAGSLGPNDHVWLEGQPCWAPAFQLPGLSFQSRKQSMTAWLRTNPALATCLIGVAIVMFAVPSWYVIGLASQRQTAAERKAEAVRLAIEKEDQRRKDKLAEMKESINALESREERLTNQRLQVQSQLETVRLQYTTLQLGEIRDQRVREKLAGLEADLETMDDKIVSVQDQIAEQRREFQQKRADDERWRSEQAAYDQRMEGYARENVQINEDRKFEEERHNKKMESKFR